MGTDDVFYGVPPEHPVHRRGSDDPTSLYAGYTVTSRTTPAQSGPPPRTQPAVPVAKSESKQD